MKRTIFFSLLTGMLLAGLAACTDDVIELPGTGDNPTEVPDGYYFVLDTDVPQGAAQTRVAYVNDNHSYFEEDDRLGIYTFDAEGNLLEPHNAEYRVLNVTNVETGNIRQVLENVNPDQRVTRGQHYVIYYPYIKDMYLDRLQNLTYGVHSQQQLAEIEHAQLSGTVSGYEVSDLLWDVATDKMTADGTTYYAEIHLDHAMANIILNIGEEYLPATRPEEGYEAYVLNSPRRATGINLTNSLTDAWSYNVNRQSSMTPIRMWNSGLGSSGAQQFRAAIPACQTIPQGTPLLQIATNEGTKQFKLKADLTLRPGKNYVFTVMKQNTDPDAPIVPDVTDDDSWVLDVLDPETGRPVGLLCREYLRYQPGLTSNTEEDKRTGTKITTAEGEKISINSQAWVFYRLQSDGKTPELSQGTVLRFIYDIDINNSGSTWEGADAAQPFWPLPNVHTEPKQGMFTPEHGFRWIRQETGGQYYGISSSEISPDLLTGDTEYAKEQQYYMHGGTITWDASNDRISDFTIIADAPTNAVAKTNGHIAINRENGKATVNYSEIVTDSHTDADGNKVGILIPRNLRDSRINESGEQKITLYPLVKIGYNQFWISRSFNPTTLIDGTLLTCYNTPGTESEPKPASLTIESRNDYLDMAYIYPYCKNVTTATGTTNYDPYNDEAEMADPQGSSEWGNRPSSYRPVPLYNKPAIENEKFIPLATESHYEYLMPTAEDIDDITNYFGFAYALKFSTRARTPVNGDANAYDDYTALMRGEMIGSPLYPANISGFNLRAIGYYARNTGSDQRAGHGMALILKSEDSVNPNSVAFLIFQTDYDLWSASNRTVFYEKEFVGSSDQAAHLYTHFFGQVRLFMRFKNPTAGGVSITTSTRSVSGSAPAESRNVYIPIQAID